MELSRFENLYIEYKDRVYNTVLSYVQNFADAEEITQDVFLDVHRKLPSFRGDAAIGTWIYRIAVNRALDRIRYYKRKKRGGLTVWISGGNSIAENDEPVDFQHPGVVMEDKENAVILWRAMNSLTDNQRTAFILRQIENLSQAEIAGIMRLSEGAVESLIQRAKQNLRKEIEKYFEP